MEGSKFRENAGLLAIPPLIWVFECDKCRAARRRQDCAIPREREHHHLTCTVCEIEL